MPAVLAAGNVLQARRTLPADGRWTATEEFREKRQRAAARNGIQPGGCRRGERHLVDVRSGARRYLQASEPGARIRPEGREDDTGRAADARYREFVLGSADPERALREVGRRVVRVEERAARSELQSRVEPGGIRKVRSAVEHLDRRSERDDVRHRVSSHGHRVERAAGVVGAAHRIERVAVGREPEPAIGSGQARRIGGRNREVRWIGERDRERGAAPGQKPDRDRERLHASACARARSRRDAVAIARWAKGGVGSIFQGS